MKWEVEIIRISTGCVILPIEADTLTEARQKALDVADQYSYPEKVKYEVSRSYKTEEQ